MKKQLIPKRVFINPIYKDKAVVLKTCEETGGKYSLGELEVLPGGGNSMHRHAAFVETFTALSGTLGVAVKNKKYFLRPGDSIAVPVNTPHHFFNKTKEVVTCRIKFEPGHEGFPKGLAIGYGLAADGKTNKKGIPNSLTHLALLISLTDTRPVGLTGLLFPFFKWLARRAKKRGIEKALLERYYYEPAEWVPPAKSVYA